MAEQIEIRSADHSALDWIRQYSPFQELESTELEKVWPHLKRWRYRAGEEVVQEHVVSTSAYFVLNGRLALIKFDRVTDQFNAGGFFGEISLLDQKPRSGTIVAEIDSDVLEISKACLDELSRTDSVVALKLYRRLALYMTEYVRNSASLYQEMDVLLVQDGGCAPGYNPVTAFVTEYLEKQGRKVFIAATGFKSIVHNHDDDYRCLISDEHEFRHLEHIPGVIHSAPLREARGAAFRTERFPEFKEEALQQKAAVNLAERKVKAVIAIGGNGTFKGIRSLTRFLPEQVQTFFIPVTIDSDVLGSDCIGEYTGVEMGAEKIRCYMADAHTHHRCYVIEMMGADGGFHALHSCLGAGADLAVLPNSEYDHLAIARALNERDGGAVVVVAEGYKKQERKDQNYTGNAAEFFRDEIMKTGVAMKLRLVCESFSRDIRGAAPNNLDIMLSQRMARKVTLMLTAGMTQQMPAVLSGKEYNIPFSDITTSNSVESELASLSNKLL
ncbi:MAG: 6-phosphofructokinase [Leptospiraceae bacterium]|nr:6-phosphofructokinase [Leptospiraceae bacterium]